MLWSLLYGGPLDEEPGWRGYGLPNLLARHHRLRASELLGAVWGLWHLPLHVMERYDAALAFTPSVAVALALCVGSSIALSIIFTWLYLRPDGNVLLAVTLHLAANLSTGWLVPVGAGTSLGSVFLAVGLAVQGRLWRQWPPDPARGLLGDCCFLRQVQDVLAVAGVLPGSRNGAARRAGRPGSCRNPYARVNPRDDAHWPLATCRREALPVIAW